MNCLLDSVCRSGRDGLRSPAAVVCQRTGFRYEQETSEFPVCGHRKFLCRIVEDVTASKPSHRPTTGISVKWLKIILWKQQNKCLWLNKYFVFYWKIPGTYLTECIFASFAVVFKCISYVGLSIHFSKTISKVSYLLIVSFEIIYYIVSHSYNLRAQLQVIT